MIRPRFMAVDHVSRTVPDLVAAVSFYVQVLGALELYRIGPIDGEDIPPDAQGRDWMEEHVGVQGARIKLAMLQLVPDLKVQLIQYERPVHRDTRAPRNCDPGGHHIALRVEDVDAVGDYLRSHGCTVLQTILLEEGPLAGKKNLYVRDPFGLFLELVD